MTKQPTTYLFEDKPLFGLDIGHGKVRVLQLQPGKTPSNLVGYGEASFDPIAINEAGVIVTPEIIAAEVQKLFKHHLVGDITTQRVALALPSAHAFTRTMEVPGLSDKELAEAVRTEAAQYIPAAIDDLYLDYTRIDTISGNSTAFIVSMPKQIVDSYLTLAQLLGLEVIMMQPSSGAGAQLFALDGQSDIPGVIVDFGSKSADITVYDQGPVVSGTVPCGGDQITDAIAKALNLNEKEAVLVKAKYGLSHSKKQAQIEAALTPILAQLIKEIKRTIRYYEEHTHNKQHISQIIITGGGANMPGLAEYLTSSLRMAVRSFDPSSHIDFGKLQPFNITERMSYVTAVGLALTNPSEVFA